MISDQQRIANALDIVRDGISDGDHHKMWVIDQMVRALTGCPMVTPPGCDYEVQGESEEFRALWDAQHAGPSVPAPSDEQVRAFLERHPAAFRGFADRERRRDPGWVRGMFRRDARIRGVP